MDDELLAYVCDKLCRYPREIEDQDELDDLCEQCPLITGEIPDEELLSYNQAIERR